MAEEAAEVVEVIVVEVIMAASSKSSRTKTSPAARVASVAPNTQIFLQESGGGAGCTIDGGKGLIFVRNHPPVHGKMSLRQSPRNETGTSPAVILLRMT